MPGSEKLIAILVPFFWAASAGHDDYVQTVRGAGYRFSTQLQGVK